MMIREKILQIAEDNNGFVTTTMVNEAGIARANLTSLVEEGELEKTARGVYILPEVLEDEFVNYQFQFKKGVFSSETALFLHDLTDRTPISFSMNFPEDYNLTRPKLVGIKATRSKEVFYSLGIETIISPAGNEIHVYNSEKTLCDLLRPYNDVETHVISEAFKRYVRCKEKNIPKLLKYAKILKVEKKVHLYLEVLL